MSFISIMTRIGHDIKVGWEHVVKYLPAVATLAELVFPASAAIPAVVNALGLIQQAVATVEQKFVASGAPTGSGPQKLAQVIAIVGPTVSQLLASEKIEVNSTQLTNIVNAVVAVLNVQSAPPS
jgi:hypothetical protein